MTPPTGTGPLDNDAAAKAEAARRANEAARKAHEKIQRDKANEADKANQAGKPGGGTGINGGGGIPDGVFTKPATDSSTVDHQKHTGPLGPVPVAAPAPAAEDLPELDDEAKVKAIAAAAFPPSLFGLPGVPELRAGLKDDVPPLAPGEAAQEFAAITEDLQHARTPEEVAELGTRAMVLQGRAFMTEPLPDPAMLTQIMGTSKALVAAGQGLQALEEITAGLAGTPEEQLAAHARLLAEGEELKGQFAAIGLLPPALQVGVDAKLGLVNNAVNPAHVTALLGQVDPAALSPETLGHLGALRAIEAPGLQAALDDVAVAVLENGGVPAEAVLQEDGLGQLFAPLAASDDGDVRDLVEAAAEGWTEELVSSHVDSLAQQRMRGELPLDQAHDLLTAGLAGFERDMRKLAENTGLGAMLGEAGAAALDQRANKLNFIETGVLGTAHVQSDFDEFVGDIAGGIASLGGALGDLVGGALGALGDLGGIVLKGAGKVLDVASHAAGDAFKLVTDGAALLMDTVGLDAAAESVRDVGETVDDIADGFGDVAELTLETLGEALQHGPMAAVEHLADEIIGEEQFPGQLDGLTGVIANRLGEGDAVFVAFKLEGEVSIGPQAGAGVNGEGAQAGAKSFIGANLTGGAQMSRDSEGNILLTLEAGAGVAAGVRAEEKTTGQTGSAEAKLSAGANGSITLKFDPEDVDDAALLTSIIEPDLGLAITNPLAAATLNAEAFQRATETNLDSFTVGATAGAEAGVKLEVDAGVASAEVGVKATMVASVKKTFFPDGGSETTTSMSAGAEASASLKVEVPGLDRQLGAKASAADVQSLSVRENAAGEVEALSAVVSVEKDGADNGFSANAGEDTKIKLGMKEGSTTVVEVSLNEAGMELATARIADGEKPADVFADLSKVEGLTTITTIHTETDSFSLGLSFDLGLGIGAKVGAEVTFGKSHTEVEVVESEVDAAESGAPGGAPALRS